MSSFFQVGLAVNEEISWLSSEIRLQVLVIYTIWDRCGEMVRPIVVIQWSYSIHTREYCCCGNPLNVQLDIARSLLWSLSHSACIQWKEQWMHLLKIWKFTYLSKIVDSWIPVVLREIRCCKAISAMLKRLPLLLIAWSVHQ